MDEILYRKSYQEYKQELTSELNKTAEGFVKIGYLLRIAQDTDILRESEYNNVNEFAMKEFGLDKSQVSRFIGINERFSQNGYSDALQDKYQGYGVAKLGIMLQLPDAINEELNPGMSKSEIQSIKEEMDEENKVSDIELHIEAAGQPASEESNIEKAFRQLLKNERELYKTLYEICENDDKDRMYEAFAPSGDAIWNSLVVGVGRVMISFKDDMSVTMTAMRTGEKEKFTLEYILDTVKTLMVYGPGFDYKSSWEHTYSDTWPEEEKKPEVAPVQQSKPKKKEAPKKPSKVHKAVKEDKKPEKTEVEESKVEEEQLPGQDSIMNHPEYLPEEMQTGTDCSEIENNLSETEEIAPVQLLSEQEIKDIWLGIEKDELSLSIFVEDHVWEELISGTVNTEALKTTYTYALNVAAGLEKLLLNSEKRDKAEE